MNRRTFLSVASGVIVSPTISGRISSSDNNDQSDEFCVQIDDNTSAFRTPSEDPSFVVSGDPDVEVYWKSNDFFEELGYLTAQGIARVGGRVVILNKDDSSFVDDYVLMHELAHCRGYHHGDGGIVNTDTTWFPTGDRTGDKLKESTKEVGESYDAYEIYDQWDVETLGELGVEFAQDNLLVTELGKAGQRFASNSSIEDLHIKNSHNGFGGEYNSGPQPDSDNVYAGRFYK